MKFCTFPFEYFYVDDYKGHVALCPWMKWDVIYIGRLGEQSAEDIWHGQKANALREKMRKGDFSACRPEGCPMLQNNSLPDLDAETAKNYAEADTPKIVNLAFDFMCNQSCETCRPVKFRPILPHYKNYMETIHRQIIPFMDKAKRITTSGHGDPFASPYMMKILKELRPANPDFQILFETNGVYLDRSHWDKLKHLEEFFIETVVTVNSFNEFVYSRISRGGNLRKLLHNLSFMRKLRKTGVFDRFSLCFVIQDRNFRELPEAIERCFREYAADQVILRPVYQWGTMPDDVFWVKDVLNPMHPYHGEYLELLESPIMNDPRVFNFGGKSVHEARPYPGKKLPANK